MRILVVVFCTALIYFLQIRSGLAHKQTNAHIENSVEIDTSIVLKILENKCNDCHKQKKKVIFTNDNLSIYYLLIEEQVFIKKRMPKGRDFKLTEFEKIILSNWIESMKI